jgi:hypothetical protein
LTHFPGIPRSAKVKVIGPDYPLWKILGSAFFELLMFGLLANLCFYLLLWHRQTNTDGWHYPQDELRWFLAGLSVYLLLRHEVAELSVPLFWPAQVHLFAERMALSVVLWSLNILLLHGRFSDRSCIERARIRPPSRAYDRFAHLALLASLSVLAYIRDLNETTATCLLAIQAVPLLVASVRAARHMEWPRVLKRSSLPPLLLYGAMILQPFCAALSSLQALRFGNGSQDLVEAAGWCLILLSGLRMRAYNQSREKSWQLARDCRELLIRHSEASIRLQALCDFVADEWGAARISVISVEEDVGLVLASAGPDSIPHAQRAEPRRLGPFLRRVCKQDHMLYAPVAEELGQDLQNQGLKHSSLAIPLWQERKVQAVVCMMADEGERIPPGDASQLELLVETLSLEILSAVAQHVAENKTSHLFDIARTADALAVENLDHWGHFHQVKEAENRVMIGGDCVPAGPFFDQLKRSPVLGKIWSAYRTELRMLWTALAAAFEFIPKDNRDDFWVISPRQFQNPLLQELGPERVAILLGAVLERQARSLLAKSCYSVFGYCGVRLASGKVGLQRSSWHGSAVEIHSDDFSLLLELRHRALPGTLLFHGNPKALATGGQNAFSCRARPWEELGERQIFSILSASADKKEMKRIEGLALEKVRASTRKVA